MTKDQDKGWLESRLEDQNFQRLLAREDFIEDFLSEVTRVMEHQQITRADLARRMGCRPSNVTQMFRRTRNLTAASMVDLAFHLKLQLRLVVERQGERMSKLAYQPAWHDRAADSPSHARDNNPAFRPLVHIAQRSGRCVLGAGWTRLSPNFPTMNTLAF